MAEEPNKADPPPTHDLYSLNHTGRNLLQPVYSRKSAEHRTRINQYLRIRPVKPLIRTCWKPQFWQFVSTRTPGWKFNPCDRVEELVVSKSFKSTTLTKVGARRRVVSLRLAETTTPSKAIASSSISKSSSNVFPLFRGNVASKCFIAN